MYSSSVRRKKEQGEARERARTLRSTKDTYSDEEMQGSTALTVLNLTKFLISELLSF